jgi:hypothetical protein
MRVLGYGVFCVLLLAAGCESPPPERAARVSAERFIRAWQDRDVKTVREMLYVSGDQPGEPVPSAGISSAEADRMAVLLTNGMPQMLAKIIKGVGRVVADDHIAAVELYVTAIFLGPADQVLDLWLEPQVLILRGGKIDVLASPFIHVGGPAGGQVDLGIRPHEWQDVVQAAGGKVHHIVLCWLKDPADEASRSKLMDVSHSLKNLPGVVDISVGRAIPSDRPIVDDSFDVAVDMTFADEAALAAYLQAANEVLKPLTQKVVVYDFTE